jgi:hypothetical protein
MHTPRTESNGPGLGAAAKQVAEHASALARLEFELAGLELKRKVVALGLGIGLLVGGVIFLLFALGFGLAAGAAALATTLSTWLSLLIVTGGLVAVALLLFALALGRLRRGTPPVPEQAIEEARLTAAAVRSNGR